MEKIYFTCGLPRSGSTLIQNILAQNPRFHATETSGFMDVLFSIRNLWTNQIEHKAHPCPERLLNVLKGALSGYFADVEKPVVFGKNRGVLPYIELMEQILGNKIKIIVPVRPIPDILASFEKLYRETSKVRQPPGEAENYFQFQTVKGRCDFWMRPDQVVGLAKNRIEDAIARGFADRMFLLDFNNLTKHPLESMQKLYEFIDEPYFQHDFDNVEQVTQENDEIHGFVNLHKIQNKVKPVPSVALQILGKSVIDSLNKV